MSEHTISVVSDAEALEFCVVNGYKYVKTYQGRGNNAGKLMLLYEVYERIPCRKSVESVQSIEKDYLVCARSVSGSLMYVGARGVVFAYTKAQRFTQEEATVKAAKMRTHGRYTWYAQKLNRII